MRSVGTITLLLGFSLALFSESAEEYSYIPHFTKESYQAAHEQFYQILKGRFAAAASNTEKKTLSLCSQIHSRHSFAKIIRNKVKPEILNQKVSLYKVTPLHVAVGVNRTNVIDWLLSKLPNLNLQDRAGFTPLHLAALHETKEVYNKLVRAGADETIIDNYGATPQKLWDLTHMKHPKEQKIKIFSLINDEVETIDAVEFYDILGARYIETTKATPKDIIQLWAASIKEFPVLEVEFPTDPSVYIKLDYDKESDLEVEPIGWGLFASEGFGPQEIITEYQGRWMPKRHSLRDAEYAYSHINPELYRGYGAYIQDSFPNAALVEFHKEGLPNRIGIVATEPIKAGDQILLDYREHPVKWNLHKEFRVMNFFAFSHLTTEKIIDSFIEEKAPMGLAQKLFYVLNTPSAMMHFVVSSNNGPQKTLKLLNSSKCNASQNCLAIKNDMTQLATFLAENWDGLEFLRLYLAQKAADGRVMFLMNFIHSLVNLTEMQSELISPEFSEDEKLALIAEYWRKVVKDTCDDEDMPPSYKYTHCKK